VFDRQERVSRIRGNHPRTASCQVPSKTLSNYRVGVCQNLGETSNEKGTKPISYAFINKNLGAYNAKSLRVLRSFGVELGGHLELPNCRAAGRGKVTGERRTTHNKLIIKKKLLPTKRRRQCIKSGSSKRCGQLEKERYGQRNSKKTLEGNP